MKGSCIWLKSVMVDDLKVKSIMHLPANGWGNDTLLQLLKCSGGALGNKARRKMETL